MSFYIFVIYSVRSYNSSAIAMRPLIEGIILKKLPIAEGKPVFSAWKTPPVSPVMYFRAFNLTNEDAFLRGTT